MCERGRQRSYDSLHVCMLGTYPAKDLTDTRLLALTTADALFSVPMMA
jgi:hypothetical protein